MDLVREEEKKKEETHLLQLGLLVRFILARLFGLPLQRFGREFELEERFFEIGHDGLRGGYDSM